MRKKQQEKTSARVNDIKSTELPSFIQKYVTKPLSSKDHKLIIDYFNGIYKTTDTTEIYLSDNVFIRFIPLARKWEIKRRTGNKTIEFNYNKSAVYDFSVDDIYVTRRSKKQSVKQAKSKSVLIRQGQPFKFSTPPFILDGKIDLLYDMFDKNTYMQTLQNIDEKLSSSTSEINCVLSVLRRTFNVELTDDDGKRVLTFLRSK
jgi:hypothetical protein